MEKIDILTDKQKLILKLFGEDKYLRETFYFTGGTALSVYYLNHRYSEDLDFFSEENFNVDDVIKRLRSWGEKYNFIFEHTTVVETHIFMLKFKKGDNVKVDFNYYPVKPLKKYVIFDKIRVNSLFDIATNKLLTITSRTEVKDFVDLYFLFKKFTTWDLIEGLRVKFRFKNEPIFLATDFANVKKFTSMPRMIKPLKLEALKEFFTKKAEQMVSRSVI